MNPVKWYVSGIFTLVMSVVSVLIGMSILPTAAIAQKKGIFIPWLATWGMVWITALVGVVIARGMFRYPASKGR